MKLFFLSVFLILVSCLPFVGKAEINEAFDPSLRRLNSLELLNQYIDSIASANGIEKSSREEVLLVNNVIENRFYHGYCHYSPEENFLAYLSGKYLWDHLSALVISEDILKYDYAACSQQAIVMMRVLKSRGYEVRKLGLVGHFVLEVYHDGKWRFYDPNKEPTIQGIPHDSLQKWLENGKLAEAYRLSEPPEAITKMFSQMEVGAINEYPAKKARFFHNVTKFFSHNFLWLTLITLSLFVLIRKRIIDARNARIEATKEAKKKVFA